MSLVKGSKTLQKANQQESNTNESQVRAKGVAQCEELHIAVGHNVKFMPKTTRPLSDVKQVFDDAYKLALLPKIKMFLVFHVSL